MAAKKTAAKKITTAKKSSPAKKTAAKNGALPETFAEVFGRLRAILAPHVHGRGLVVKNDEPALYYVESAKPYQGKPLFVGGVRAGKAYVSYHFFPLYMFPELGVELAPALKKRMQGKTCFNFKAVDEAAFAGLVELTAKGVARFCERGLV